MRWCTISYLTSDEYYQMQSGELADEADFHSLCTRATEIIEEMTMYRLTPERFEVMSCVDQTRIKKAICAQIEYLDANGGSDLDNGAGIQSASIGKFSYTQGGATNGELQSIYSPRAQRILFPTGLLYRGGGCY